MLSDTFCSEVRSAPGWICSPILPENWRCQDEKCTSVSMSRKRPHKEGNTMSPLVSLYFPQGKDIWVHIFSITSGPVVHESPTPVKKLSGVQHPGPWLGPWRCLLWVSWLLWFWIFLKHLPIFILCVCMSVCVFHVRVLCLWWLEEGARIPWNPSSQAFVNCPVWMLGTEP